MPPCPINWKKEDGPHPCAFKSECGRCTSNGCIPEHIERYNHALEIITTVCPECNNPAKTTRGEYERGYRAFCEECSDKYQEGLALADHVAGRI